MHISNFGLNSGHLVHTTVPSYYPLQDINDPLVDENNPLVNPLPNIEKISALTIPAPVALSPSSEEIQLSFQEGTSLNISHSQLALLREKSLYFKNRNLTGDGLAHLTPLTALQHLNLSKCYHLTDAGLASFKASILIQ